MKEMRVHLVKINKSNRNEISMIDFLNSPICENLS